MKVVYDKHEGSLCLHFEWNAGMTPHTPLRLVCAYNLLS